MKNIQSPMIAKYLPAFVAPKNDFRPLFQCVKYTGQYGIATNAKTMLIFPSKIPAMLQNYYTREIFDGEFPDVAKVIPLEFEFSTNISREVAGELIRATTCAISYFGKRFSECACMKLEFTSSAITMSCKSSESSMQFVIPSISEGTFAICFNPKRFIGVISCAHAFCKTEENIAFGFAGTQKAAVISVGEIKIVLTPMRVDPQEV